MNSIYKTVTIVGVTAVLCGLAPAVCAQPSETSKLQPIALDFLNQGLNKAKRGDYHGAIANYTQALIQQFQQTGE